MGAYVEYFGGGAGGSDVVNGILKEYYSSGAEISANTFVQFVAKKDGAVVECGLVNNRAASQENRMYAIKLSSNKVFFAYLDSSTSYAVYAVIVTFTNNTLSVGTAVLLAAGNYGSVHGLYVSYVNSTTVYVAPASLTTIYKCAISGATITVSNLTTSSKCYGMAFIESGKILHFTRGSRSTSTRDYEILQAGILALSGSAFSGSYDTKIKEVNSDSATIYPCPDVLCIAPNTFIVVARSDNVANLFYVKVSGTTITVASYAGNLGSSTYFGSACVRLYKLSSSKFLINYGGKFAVCTLSGTTITVGTILLLSNIASLAVGISVKSENEVYITYGDSSNLIMQKLQISGTTITASDTMILNEYSSPSQSIYISGTKHAAFYNRSNGLNALLFDDSASGTFIKSATSKIEGLTKTKATPDTKGKVWELDA